MNKLPFIQWYPADYIAATRHLSHLAKSVWSDLLNFMALERPRGIYERPKDTMIRQFNIPVDQLDSLLSELATVAHVEVGHDTVTLTSRRMVNDERERLLTLNRKRKERGIPPVTVPSIKSHREKLEVRVQKLEVRESTTPPVLPQELVPADVTPKEMKPYAIPLPEEKPADSLVLFYKVLQGVPHDRRSWDKSWGRWKALANELLEIFDGEYAPAYQCLKTKAEELTAANRTWNLGTIVNQADLWKQQHGGEDHALINRERFLRDVIEQRRARKIEGLRESSTPGEVLRECGDRSDLPPGNQEGAADQNKGGGIVNGRTLETVQSGNLESEEDRKVPVPAHARNGNRSGDIDEPGPDDSGRDDEWPGPDG